MIASNAPRTEFTNAKKSGMINKQQFGKMGVGAVNRMRHASASADDDEAKDSLSPMQAPKQRVSIHRGSQASRRTSVGKKRGSLVSQKRGSILSERRSSELQLDNADRLSGLMLHCKQVMDELEIDYESDFDE